MILQQKYRSVNNFSEKIHRLFMKFLCNLSTFSLSVLLNFMHAARSFEQYARKRPPKTEGLLVFKCFSTGFLRQLAPADRFRTLFFLPKAIFCGNLLLFQVLFPSKIVFEKIFSPSKRSIILQMLLRCFKERSRMGALCVIAPDEM